MPADQRGQTYRTNTGWGIRYYDETGCRRRKSGFRTKSEARAWFDEVERPRQRGVSKASTRIVTFSELVDQYLEAHAAGREAATIRTLRERLAYALSPFGSMRLRELQDCVGEIAAWQATLPPGSRYGITQAFRQTLEAGVRWRLMSQNPAKLAGPNPQPRPKEFSAFTRSEIDLLAIELGRWGPIAVFASETGMRPEEWLALEWRDVSREQRVALVERTFSGGKMKPYGKTTRSRRRVPLSERALDALDTVPRRIDSGIIFRAPGGGGGVAAGHGRYLDLHNFRAREWKPALEAAGLSKDQRIMDLRHTFATLALAAGIPIFELARYMGTSVEMIDRTYGHLAPGSEDVARAKLDAHAKAEEPGLGHEWATS